MKINRTVGSVDIRLDTRRIDNNTRNAQRLLNMQVVADCDPLVPFRQGGLRGSVVYPDGIYGGEIEWNMPYAHYQYKKIVYEPNIPIRDSAGNVTGWYSPPHKTPTNRTLTYHTPGTTGEWFSVAKSRCKSDWLRLVKETAGRR